MSNSTLPEFSRAAEITAALHEAPDNRDHAAVRAYLHRLCGLGLAVVFVHPGAKKPADLRTARHRIADDKAAREVARAAGNPNWRKARSASGLALASTDCRIVDRYLNAYIKTFPTRDDDGRIVEPAAVNIGIELGASGLVIVDADTPEQVSTALADGVGDAPTVSTPGWRGADGKWAHSDGGHWYFVVPKNSEVPTKPGSLKSSSADDGYMVLWNRHQVLVPPSTRPEGAYKAVGTVRVLPDWLHEQVVEHGRVRAERAARSRGAAAHDGPVAAWGASVTWGEILADTDWTNTGKPDSCGCDVWTAPGLHSSPKSATAHEPGCAVFSDSPDPPLHIWTDHDIEPFTDCGRGAEGRTVTRLDAVAAIHYEKSVRAAMSALNLHNDEPQTLSAAGGDDDSRGGDDPTTIGVATGHAVTYPPEFWDSRASLQRVRDAALAQRVAPDAMLACILARLSARIPPGVRVDTGIMRPLPLNMFSALVSRSGQGKTSAIGGSDVVVDFELSWSMDPLRIPDEDQEKDCPVRWAVGDEFPRQGKVRSGEGIAAVFYGDVKRLNPGTKKMGTSQAQVRTNALMTTDEGAALVKHILDERGTVGETMREAWSGSAIGQSNADRERYRYVPAGRYSLGMIIGFQLSALADLLTAQQLELGTPQRLLCTWSRPDRRIATPERLAELRAQTDPRPLQITVPRVGLRLCAPLREKVDVEHLEQWLADDSGSADGEPIESHRVAMVARVAALLAIVDSRAEVDDTGALVVTEDDWALAEVMFERSCAIARLAVADRRQRQAKVKRDQRATDLASSIEDEDARATPEGRAAVRIVAYLVDLGPGRHRWSGKNGLRAQKFNPGQHKDADAGLAHLVAAGRIRRMDEGKSTFIEFNR